MIFTERKITVRKGVSTIDEPVILYRGDFEVELRFTIMETKFRFKSGVNLVDSEKASHAQLALLAPDGTNVFTEVGKCENGTAIFVLTKEMIDELSEVGKYSFQIRLFDYYRESRISIPPVEFGIEVREPVASEDHTNVVDQAMVGYSIAKTSVLDEEVPETFDINGQYNKTDWETGDRISEGKLNKIEDAIDKLNQNEMTDAEALNKQMNSNFNVLQTQIDNLIIESGDTDMEIIQARGSETTLNNRLNKMETQSAERFDEVNSQLEQVTLNINSFKNDNSWNDAFDLAYEKLPTHGGCIFIPQLIEIDRSINLMELEKKYGAKRIHIKSNGWFETSIIKKGDFDGIILTGGCSISDLRIDGDNTDNHDGIWVNGAGCVLTNVSSFYHGGNGIKVGNKKIYPDININSDFCKFYNVHCVANNNYGLVVSDEIDSDFNTSDANACMFYSLDIRLNKVGGILVENCIDNHFYSPMCEGNGEYGIRVGAECGGIHIYSPYVEKSTTEILLDEGSRCCMVIGSRCGSMNSNIENRGNTNTVLGLYGSKFSGYYLSTPINMKEINLGEKETSGYYKIVQNSDKDLEIMSCYGSGNVIFANHNGEQETNIHCKSARFGSKDLLNSIRQRPSSITNAITITANSSIKTSLSVMTNISVTDAVVANPITQLPNGITYYPIVNGDNSVSIVFTNSTSESVSIPQTTWRVIAFNVTTIV